MCDTTGLFEKKSIIGAKLEEILNEKGYTKVSFCKDVHISRPTLDKILTGTLTSPTTYNKHISKILDFLSISPDVLLGNVKNPYNKVNTIRNKLRISSEKIANITGIPLERLDEIEAGGDATLAELRDIALCLSTSVNCIQNTYYFEPQTSIMDAALMELDTPEPDWEDDEMTLSGFWGHLGVLPANTSKYLWFPITENTYEMIVDSTKNAYMVIPCMNNKVLFLNMKHINRLVLLDEECDAPEELDWDYNVDCGGTPMVVYEALDEYLMEDSVDEKTLSPFFCKYLDKLLETDAIDEGSIHELLWMTTVQFADGKIALANIDFDESKDILDDIEYTYEYHNDAVPPMREHEISNTWLYRDFNGEENILTLRNISMIEFPLMQLEKAIYAKLNFTFNANFEEFMEEYGE